MIDVDRFVAERGERWRRLEELLDRAERSPEWELGPEGMRELVRLYRLAATDLNRARSATADPELLGRLNALAGRGYRFVYGARRAGRPGGRLRRFLGADLPGAFRREAAAVAWAAGAFLLGALFGLAAVALRPAAAEDLIPGDFFTASPRERVERIEREEERVATLDQAALFGAQLYTHNIRVAFLAFSLGALTVAGGLWLLFVNGTILGAVAASYLLDGVAVFFLAWVGPHGALELPAIVFAGAAGLVAGRALLLPGDVSRGAALRAVFPSVWRMMLGVALILVLAGLIEGSFSQFSAKSVPYPLKIGVAAVLFAGLSTYLFLRPGPVEPREPREPRETPGEGAP